MDDFTIILPELTDMTSLRLEGVRRTRAALANGGKIQDDSSHHNNRRRQNGETIAQFGSIASRQALGNWRIHWLRQRRPWKANS